MRPTTSDTAQERVDLINLVHALVYDLTDTYDDVGKDLAYLFAAIAGESFVEWTRYDAVPELLAEHLTAEHAWTWRLLGYVSMTPTSWEED